MSRRLWLNNERIGDEAAPIEGVVSTRRANASDRQVQGKAPIGTWKMKLPNTPEVKKLFKQEKIDDILFVLTYSGRTPEWPS